MQRMRLFMVVTALLSMATFAAGVQMVMINNSFMVPLYEFGNAFGAVITYNRDVDGIDIFMGNRTVTMVPYGTIAWVDGVQVPVDAPVVINDDITYIPVNYICNAFALYCGGTPNQQVVIVNQTTYQQVILHYDVTRYQAPHRWRRTYDCRDYGCDRSGSRHPQGGWWHDGQRPQVPTGRFQARSTATGFAKWIMEWATATGTAKANHQSAATATAGWAID